jgi:hypothetical protein
LYNIKIFKFGIDNIPDLLERVLMLIVVLKFGDIVDLEILEELSGGLGLFFYGVV